MNLIAYTEPYVSILYGDSDYESRRYLKVILDMLKFTLVIWYYESLKLSVCDERMSG